MDFMNIDNIAVEAMIKIQKSSDFSKAVEKIVEETEYNYLEAIMLHAETNGIELESVPKLLTQKLKVELQKESYEMNRLGKKPSSLIDDE